MLGSNIKRFYSIFPKGNKLYFHKNKNLNGDTAPGFIIAAEGVYKRTTVCFVIKTLFQAGSNVDVSRSNSYKE
jgi:hypothetical protein